MAESHCNRSNMPEDHRIGAAGSGTPSQESQEDRKSYASSFNTTPGLGYWHPRKTPRAQPWRVHSRAEGSNKHKDHMQTRCIHTNRRLLRLMFGTCLRRTRALKKKKKKGPANVDSVASARLVAEMEQAKKNVEGGPVVWFMRGDPGRGTVISGRRADGGNCVRAVTVCLSPTHGFQSMRASLSNTYSS